jgi:hypothetical protein
MQIATRRNAGNIAGNIVFGLNYTAITRSAKSDRHHVGRKKDIRGWRENERRPKLGEVHALQYYQISINPNSVSPPFFSHPPLSQLPNTENENQRF